MRATVTLTPRGPGVTLNMARLAIRQLDTDLQLTNVTTVTKPPRRRKQKDGRFGLECEIETLDPTDVRERLQRLAMFRVEVEVEVEDSDTP